jgi:hypothetical protein
MREQGDCTLSAPVLPSQGELVSIYVDHCHPLLQLKGALPWEAIEALMVAAWRKAGKNVAGSRGKAWPVSLYVPLLVLMLIKRLDSREKVPGEAGMEKSNESNKDSCPMPSGILRHALTKLACRNCKPQR